MTRVRLNTLSTFSAIVLLAAASVTSSDAKPHANRVSPTQSESVYYNSDYNGTPRPDNSCFSSTGLPEMYACSSHGG